MPSSSKTHPLLHAIKPTIPVQVTLSLERLRERYKQPSQHQSHTIIYTQDSATEGSPVYLDTINYLYLHPNGAVHHAKPLPDGRFSRKTEQPFSTCTHSDRDFHLCTCASAWERLILQRHSVQRVCLSSSSCDTKSPTGWP